MSDDMYDDMYEPMLFANFKSAKGYIVQCLSDRWGDANIAGHPIVVKPMQIVRNGIIVDVYAIELQCVGSRPILACNGGWRAA